MRQDLRVAPCSEGVSLRGELGSQGQVVVELAVLDSPDGLVLVRERLVSAGDVHDRESPGAECHSRRDHEPAVVGPTMCHEVGHGLEPTLFDHRPGGTPELDHAADSAHGSSVLV